MHLIRTTISSLATAGIVGSILLTGGGAASAASSDRAANEQVFVDPGFDPSRGYDVVGAEERDLQLTPDGTGASRLASCDIWRNAVAIPGAWKNSVTGCGYIGSSKNAVVYYAWEKTGGGSRAKACMQGKGFNALHAPVWQNSGCGTKGSTALLWGNVAANKQIRMYSSGGIVNLNWR